MVIDLRFSPEMSFVIVTRAALAGNTRSSPSTGTTLPAQLAMVFQLPLELPSHVFVAAEREIALAKAKKTCNARRGSLHCRQDAAVAAELLLITHRVRLISSQENEGKSFKVLISGAGLQDLSSSRRECRE